MAVYRHIHVQSMGDITLVRFADRKILDQASIQELGRELMSLVEKDKRDKLLLNFTDVDFLSSAALSALLKLNNAVKSAKGKLKLSNIRPEIKEVFMITRLNKVFDIRDDEADALVAF